MKVEIAHGALRSTTISLQLTLANALRDVRAGREGDKLGILYIIVRVLRPLLLLCAERLGVRRTQWYVKVIDGRTGGYGGDVMWW